jgi:hypothetical protein
MTTLFLTCLLLGGVVLLLQAAASFLGLEHGGHDVPHHDAGHIGHIGHIGHAGHGGHGAPHEHAAGDGLNLLTVRSLSAGVAFFGLGGLAARALGPLLATLVGAVAGLVAAVAVAVLMRQLLRLESDGTLDIGRAVGTGGVVYLAVPGARDGAGKVHLTLQGRLVELQAVTPNDALPTGQRVLVIDVAGPDTVVVIKDPLPTELSNVTA